MGWLIRTIRKRTITKTEIAFQTHSIFSEIELLERRSGRYASTAEEEKISKVGVEVERISTQAGMNPIFKRLEGCMAIISRTTRNHECKRDHIVKNLEEKYSEICKDLLNRLREMGCQNVFVDGIDGGNQT